MKRDVLIAVGAGFLFGIIVAFVVLRLPAILKHLPSSSTPTPSDQLPPTHPPIQSTSLTISQPTDGTIVDKNQVTVTGNVMLKDTVIVFSGPNAVVAKLNEDGSFTSTIDVSEGVNTITVIATKDDIVENTSVTVYYTPEAL